MADSEIKIELTVEEKQALKAIDSINKKLKSFEDNATTVSKETNSSFSSMFSGLKTGAESGFSSLAKGVAVGNLVAGAIVMVGNTIKDFVVGSVAAAEEQEIALNRLSQALRAAGSFSEAAMDDFSAFATQLQRVSIYGDEVIIGQLAIAKSFGATNEQAKELVQAAANMSATFGGSLDSNVEKLGKTLQGSAGKLGMYVGEIGVLTKEQLKAGGAIDAVNAKFSGAAANELDTYTGRVTALGNAWSDLQEELGGTVTGSGFLKDATEVLTTVFQNLLTTISDSRIEEERRNGTMVETVSTLDQLKRAYNELQVQAIDTEQIIKNPSFFDTLFRVPTATKHLAEYNAELEVMKAKIASAQGEVDLAGFRAAEDAFAEANKPKPLDPEEEAKAQAAQAKLVQARVDGVAQLQQIEADHQAFLYEQHLLGTEITAMNRDEELANLLFFEQQKIDAVYQAEMNKAATIADAEARRYAEKAAANKKLMSMDIAQANGEKKIDDASLRVKQATEDAKISIGRQGFQLLGALAKDGSKEQFLIQKAAAVAEIAIGYGKAMALIPAQTATIPYPANLAAAAQMAGYVQLQSALGLATVAATAIKGYETGGIVPGNSMTGDKVMARVNSREGIFTLGQQKNLFDMANNGGGGEGMLAAINNLGRQIASMTIVVEADGREIARLVRDEKQSGFAV